jgi:hypothetical protein
MDRPTEGTWKTFPQGKITAGKAGAVTLKLTPKPIATRFLRIWMTESSHTSVAGASEDPRSSLGYAIREVYAGSFTNGDEFVDLIQHSPDQNQTVTYCSSIDAWHSASDLNEHAGDQTGFDLFFTSGITNRLPAMIPVAMLYGTPENSAAQIAYLKKRGYPISYLEMGEEPNGQYMLPEDYGALYVQWADAIHKVDPGLKLGGPVFEGVNEDIKVWPDAQGRTSWMGRFLDYLKARNRLSDLTFMSLEHYPFSACGVTWSDLYREPEITSHILQVWRDDGLPANVPIFITESNLAAALTHEMVDAFAALWLADSVGSFLAAGGKAYYHSPIQPEPLRRGCHGWGTYGNFVADNDLHIRAYTSQYFASRLINREWVRHGAGIHQMFSASCDLKDDAGHVLVTTYAVRRPDNTWSVLLVNKDQSNAHRIRISVRGLDNSAPRSFSGPVTVVSFGREQYRWRGDGGDSGPNPDGPPVRSVVPANGQTQFTLPKASVTVVRGNLSA